MADRFRALGGEILTGRVPEGAAIEDGRVTEVHVEGRVIPTSYVAWTGTVHSLARLLDLPAPKVSYLALVCYYMTLSDGPPHDFQWSYHGTSDIIFSRISVPSNFDPANAPPGKRAICVEVSCYEGDEQYEHPERILDRLADDLVRERVLKSTEEIESVRFERFAWAYPVYHLDYRTELKRFDKSLASVKNVLRAGRLGKFWYNNMDHCVGAAFAHADKIAANLTGTPSKKEVAA
ncbi:MAG: hypothetical protein M5R36_24580 [Deltaproteobacteria bacterium]|nr:hypothetical protein [Deltaproteobacteria bacterium]